MASSSDFQPIQPGSQGSVTEPSLRNPDSPTRGESMVGQSILAQLPANVSSVPSSINPPRADSLLTPPLVAQSIDELISPILGQPAPADTIHPRIAEQLATQPNLRGFASSSSTSSPIAELSITSRLDRQIFDFSGNATVRYKPQFEEAELSRDDETRLFDSTPTPLASTHVPESTSVLPSSGPSQPRSKSIRQFMSPVKSQGQRGSCSVFAAVGLLEYALDYILSEQWIARFSSDEDPGITRHRIEWAVTHGLKMERDCRYDSRYRSVLHPHAETSGELSVMHLQLEVKSPTQIDPLAFVKAKLDEGYPVGVSAYVLGMWWYESYNQHVLHIPSESEIQAFRDNPTKDSHAFIITGYDDVTQSFEFKNSWGRTWKDGGYGRMSFEYFRRFHTSNDLVVVKKEPWDVNKIRNEIVQSDEASRWLVREYFREFLGRDANDADIQYHMANLHQHGVREHVRTEIAISDEASRWRIRDFFKKYLGRDANEGDVLYHLAKIQSHGDWGQIETEIAKCNEASKWRIRGFFYKYLGRDANDGDILYHLAKIESHGNWGNIETEIAKSDEASRWRIRDFFKKHLGRDATDGDILYYLPKIQSHGDWGKIEAEIVTSDEASRWRIRGFFIKHLGREATDGDILYYLPKIQSHRDWSKIETEIAISDEASRCFIRTQFMNYLGRRPNEGDMQYHLTNLQGHNNRERVRTEIAQCDEATRWLVRTYYWAYLGREANPHDVQYHLNHFQPYGNLQRIGGVG